MAISNPQATALIPAAATSIAGSAFALITGGLAGLILFGYMVIVWLSLVTPITAAALSVWQRSTERRASRATARLQVIAIGAAAICAAFVLFPVFSFFVTALFGLASGDGWTTSHFTIENAVIWWRSGAPLAGLYLVALAVTGIATTQTEQDQEGAQR